MTTSYVWDETVRTRHEKVSKPGEFWESGTWVPVEGVVFTLQATAGSFEASATLPTVKEAREIAAQFPKNAAVQAGPVTGGDWKGYRGYVSVRAKLSADGINKGANETGLRRYRTFARHAARLGYQVRYQTRFSNSLAEDEFRALVEIASGTETETT